MHYDPASDSELVALAQTLDRTAAATLLVRHLRMIEMAGIAAPGTPHRTSVETLFRDFNRAIGSLTPGEGDLQLWMRNWALIHMMKSARQHGPFIPEADRQGRFPLEWWRDRIAAVHGVDAADVAIGAAATNPEASHFAFRRIYSRYASDVRSALDDFELDSAVAMAVEKRVWLSFVDAVQRHHIANVGAWFLHHVQIEARHSRRSRARRWLNQVWQELSSSGS